MGRLPEDHEEQVGELGRFRPSVALIVDGAGWAGTERHVRGLLLGLTQKDWAVHLIACEDGPLTDEAASLGLAVTILARRSSLGYLMRLRRSLRRLRPAVVHAHSGRLACLAARLARVPVVLETRHGLPERTRRIYARVPWTRRWEGLKSLLAHRTIAVCRADAAWLIQAGLPSRRITVVQNGIEPTPVGDPGTLRRAFDWPSEAVVVGFVGRLTRQKAPHRFLEMLRRLDPLLDAASDNRGQRKLLGVICGDGPEAEALLGRAAELGLSDRIVWLGARPHAGELLPAWDMLILPSIWEGTPYVILEALAAGTPVLATPVGGVPELLTGPVLSAGCRPWEAGDWAAAALPLLLNHSDRQRWSEAARRRARDFPEAETIASLDRIYRSLQSPVGPAGRPGPARAGRLGPAGRPW